MADASIIYIGYSWAGLIEAVSAILEWEIGMEKCFVVWHFHLEMGNPLWVGGEESRGWPVMAVPGNVLEGHSGLQTGAPLLPPSAPGDRNSLLSKRAINADLTLYPKPKGTQDCILTNSLGFFSLEIRVMAAPLGLTLAHASLCSGWCAVGEPVSLSTLCLTSGHTGLWT